ncbi:MAG: hypothetical protein KC442_25130 [Thermomicrobiales bacterium]|nr:hypothetical protein [Thermomicrobiales bacterium]
MAQPTFSSATLRPASAELDPAASCHRVELFGVPQLLAGRADITVRGATLAEAAADLMGRAPQLAGAVLHPETGWPLPGYSFVVEERFTRDPALPLADTSAILLVASAAGG